MLLTHTRKAVALALTAILAVMVPLADVSAQPLQTTAEHAQTAPTAAMAAELFGVQSAVSVVRVESPAAWRVESQGDVLGLIGSTWELTDSTGYSGMPLDVLVAVSPQGKITGAHLTRHNEPVLTLGISDADIAAYVSSFAGYDPSAPEASVPDVISRATISTGVIRDGILRTARILSSAQGIGGGGIDRVAYQPADWAALTEQGALAHVRVTMADAAEALPDANPKVTPSDAPWLEMWTGLIDPPTIGRNLIGQEALTSAAGELAPTEALLVILSRGTQSHRGTEWKRSGQFERIQISQGDVRLTPSADSYTQLSGLPISGAPELKERSLFRINADPTAGGIDPMRPFRVTVTTVRKGGGSEAKLPVSVESALPAAYHLAPPEPERPLWEQNWWDKRYQIAVVLAMLAVLGLILLFQEWLVRSAVLWKRVRMTYLAFTLVVLGWILGAQLSIVQVFAFLHALLSGFRWETFLIAPLIFVLWSAVALGMLFWGRGVFCGWLCPFGALQELTNQLAQRLGVRQIAVPQALHERLWVIKYTLFVGLVALSFYSMERALVLAEVEPFKTAISMQFIRAWPFVLYVLALLTAGLFIERFYCRYICPMGAGLAIPAKLKVFDWLKRRPQCGRECRLCETKCTVGAIDPLGRINANECINCLRCQIIMNDDNTCPVLKRRSRGSPSGGGGSFTAPPIPPAPASATQPPAFISQQVTS